MYLRMVHRGKQDEYSGRAQGVFQAAVALKAAGELTASEIEELAEVLRIFDRDLPGRTTFGEIPDYAIFWFKASHPEIVRVAWQLVTILRRHDLPIEMIKTDKPGRIVYEDNLQVAAIPWRDTTR